MENLPQDPFMLLSVINTWLRDDYPDPDELCAARGLDRAELERRLGDAGFEYMASCNQFR